jgi:hypothetical protein
VLRFRTAVMTAAANSLFICLLFCSAVSCSRLDTLTTGTLDSAETKWKHSRPDVYRLVVDMKGDRVEEGRFDVAVRNGEVESLRRNEQVILPGRGQDYSMDGLFKILRQELALAEDPSQLGAPAGYSAYPMAQFDPGNGRLLRFKRTVGGTSNSIEIDVTGFETGEIGAR